jgi:HSP20 family protein
MESSGISTARKTRSSTDLPDTREQRITRTSSNFSPLTWAGHPLETMMRLSRDMDQLMDSFLGGRFGGSQREQLPMFRGDDLWSPRIDVRQAGDSLVVSAELPGITRNEVQIEATDDGIAISGERRETREEGGRDRDYHLSERSYGSFYRSIPLPEGAQGELAKATMRDGVLEITIPCKQTAKRKQIQISE